MGYKDWLSLGNKIINQNIKLDDQTPIWPMDPRAKSMPDDVGESVETRSALNLFYQLMKVKLIAHLRNLFLLASCALQYK